MEDTLPGPLFSPGEAEDPYRNLHDMVTPAAGAGKEFAERLWRQYYPFADAKFLTDLEGLVDQKNADQLGIDFLLIHNPRALRRVPHGLLPATREYWATPVNGGHELSCHDTTGADSRTAGRGISDILEEISHRRRYQGSHSMRAEDADSLDSSPHEIR